MWGPVSLEIPVKILYIKARVEGLGVQLNPE